MHHTIVPINVKEFHSGDEQPCTSFQGIFFLYLQFSVPPKGNFETSENLQFSVSPKGNFETSEDKMKLQMPLLWVHLFQLLKNWILC